MIGKHAKTLMTLCLLAFTVFAGLPVSQVQAAEIAAPVQQTGTNLLTNPGFEGIGQPVTNSSPNPDNWTRDTFSGAQYGEIYTPAGWVTWWEEGEFKRPECKVIPNQHPFNAEPNRIYEGYYSGMCFSFFGKQHAGYYQVVRDIPPGSQVQASFYAHAWTSNKDNPPTTDPDGDPYAFYFRVGVDPNGGTDPFSSSIVWSSPYYNYDEYALVGPLQTTVGETGAATIFLEAYGKWPNKHNDAYMDNASLQILSPGETPTPTAPPPPDTPETPPTPQFTPTPRPDGAIVHEVEAGDTLFGLALAYDVPVDQIYELNNLGPNDLLSIGQEIVIATSGDVTVQPTPTPTPEPAANESEATEEPTSPDPGAGGPAASPAEGTASVCVLAFYDANGNMFREADEGEMLLPNAEINLLARSGPIDSRTTDGISEPWCFTDLEPGNYILRHSPPPGYTLTDGGQVNFNLSAGQVWDLELAYVRDEEAGADNPDAPDTNPATNSPDNNPTDEPENDNDEGGVTNVLNVVLRVSGFIVLALAVAVLVLFILSRRSA
jgi:LysM repeat protein